MDLYVLGSFHLNWFVTNLFIPEWSGIAPRPFWLTTWCGESRGKYFTSISKLTRCPNIYLFKDGRPIPFCVAYLSHLTIFSSTFDSKPCLVCLCQGANKTIWKIVSLPLLLWALHMELTFRSLAIPIFHSPTMLCKGLARLQSWEPSGSTCFLVWNIYQAGFQVQVSKRKLLIGEKLTHLWPKNLSTMWKNNW